MIDVQKNNGAIFGWCIAIAIELILLAVCPLIGILIGSCVLFGFCMAANK